MTSRHRRNSPRNIGNQSNCRLTARWLTTERPTLFDSPDRRRCARVARQLAAAGALVLVEEHLGHGAWRLLQRLDGPAIVRARRAAERLATEQAEQQLLVDRQRELAAVERLMVQPPVPRDGGNPRARTVAQGRGIR
ncbi:hypothetical protein [Kitasatospora sp. NPDC088346]|uniref:hypothetical protein n=1 Tax=Kitasatospora sp. NPDC088346 TaxID=3364073 RepID=UPI00382C34A7